MVGGPRSESGIIGPSIAVDSHIMMINGAFGLTDRIVDRLQKITRLGVAAIGSQEDPGAPSSSPSATSEALRD